MNNDTKIKNCGGTRTGNERTKKKNSKYIVEKRSENDRRCGIDRRKGSGSRRVSEDGILIERRDVFRKRN